MGSGTKARRLGLAAVGAVVTATFAWATPVPAGGGAGGGGDAWVQRALELQYELGSDVGLRNAPWVGTHNSFNSRAEMGPALSPMDSNQRITIFEQLEEEIRGLELDVSWFPSPSGGGFAPVVCHTGLPGHVGCSIEKPLGPVLDEIVSWLRLPANRDQMILLHIEDHLDNEEGYDTGAATIREHLGSFLYRPRPGGCRRLPLTLTREQILAARRQVLIVSDCGVGEGWPGVIFDWRSHEETRPRGYTDFPDCGDDFSPREYRRKLIRYYEDSTFIGGNADPADRITPRTAARMARCGVDLVGLDQLVPGDPRLRKLVWSWGRGEPGRGRCAVQRIGPHQRFGRWHSRPCGLERRPACRRPNGHWLVPGGTVSARAAPAACRERDARFAVPRTGYEAQLLRLEMGLGRVNEVWLGYRREDGRWVARDRRGAPPPG
jgi:hypothetical protein